MRASSTQPLQAWQVMLGGVAGIILALGPARFAYTPLLPLMHAQAGLTLAGGGWLATINYAGYICGALLVAWIESPRWRHRLYGWGLVLGVISTALMPLMPNFAPNFWLWAVARFLGGLSGAAAMLLGSGLVLGWLVRAGRRPELGVHFSGVGFAIMLSALGSILMSCFQGDWAQQWWGFAALALAMLVPALAWRPPVPPAVVTSTAVTPDRRWMAWLMAMYFCAGWGFVISATFTVAMIEHQPLLAGKGPLAWLLVGLMATPAVFVWDSVARRLGEIGALICAFVLQIASVLMPALSNTLSAQLGGALLYGASVIGIVSLTLALVGRRSPGNPGKAMARLTLSYGVAQVIAPALAGQMVQRSGSYQSTLWLCTLVLGAGLAMLLVLRRLEQTATR